MEHFVTLFDRHFLPQGLALQISMERHIKSYRLWILCLDDYTYDALLRINLSNVALLQFSKLETASLRAIKGGRTNREYCWTLTPFAPKFVFEADPSVSKVTYIDADLWFRSDPGPIFNELDDSGKAVLITDHAYAKEHEQAKTSGQYCVQFIVFKRHEGEAVRQWWEDRCLEWCFKRFEDGKFGDQKYLEKWPILFPDKVLVSKNLDWFLAPWNSARFNFSSAVCWHFHNLRIIRLLGKIRVHAGYYWMSPDVRQYIYNPYLSDLKAALDVLTSYHIPIPIQYQLSFRETVKYLLSRVGLFKESLSSANVFDFHKPVLSPIKKITLITVCRNASAYIEETMDSVLQQTAVKNGRVNLEYLIYDGLSDDGTLEIAKKVLLKYPGIQGVKIVSEADTGLYDGLAKAMQSSSGDLLGYINAGDYLEHRAFDVLLDFFEQHPEKSWVTGLDVVYNDSSQVTNVSLPFRYRRSSIQKGLHGKFLAIIQQESTFWRNSLNQSVDFSYLRQLKYAGDAYLWKCFSSMAELTIVQAYLGGFRIHQGQLSSNMSAYYVEQKQFSDRPNLYDYFIGLFDNMLTHMPDGLKKLFNPRGLIRFNHQTGRWE